MNLIKEAYGGTHQPVFLTFDVTSNNIAKSFTRLTESERFVYLYQEMLKIYSKTKKKLTERQIYNLCCSKSLQPSSEVLFFKHEFSLFFPFFGTILARLDPGPNWNRFQFGSSSPDPKNCSQHCIGIKIKIFYSTVLRIWIRILIRRIRMFLGLKDPDPLVRGTGMDPDPEPLVRGMDPEPEPFITKQKQ